MSSFILDNLLEGDRVGILVYCFLETLYIRLKVGDVLLKVVCMGILNRC